MLAEMDESARVEKVLMIHIPQEAAVVQVLQVQMELSQVQEMVAQAHPIHILALR
jgi:hypothetical protein